MDENIIYNSDGIILIDSIKHQIDNNIKIIINNNNNNKNNTNNTNNNNNTPNSTPNNTNNNVIFDFKEVFEILHR